MKLTPLVLAIFVIAITVSLWLASSHFKDSGGVGFDQRDSGENGNALEADQESKVRRRTNLVEENGTLEESASEIQPAEGNSQPDLVISGIVRDAETGHPIVGAKVGEGRSMHNVVRTDHLGMYQLRPQLIGRRSDGTIHSIAEGYSQETGRPDKENRLDFSLQRADIVVGRLLTNDGEPVSKADVAVAALDPVRQVMDRRIGQTDEFGRFELNSVSRNMPHTFATTVKGYGQLLLDFDPCESGPGVVDLGDLILVNECRISGRVTDLRGNPVQGLRVSLASETLSRTKLRTKAQFPAAGADFFRGRMTETNKKGEYEFRCLFVGSHALILNDMTVGGQEKSIEMTLIGEQREVNFQVENNEKLRFFCCDEDGAPIPYVTISISQSNRFESIPALESDRNGKVEFLCLDPSVCNVRVWTSKSRGPDLLCPLPFDVLPSGDSIKITLVKSAMVSGRLILPNREGALGYEVVAHGEGGDLRKAMSGYDGAFEIHVPHDQEFDLKVEGSRHLPSVGNGIRVAGKRKFSGEILAVEPPRKNVEIFLHEMPRTLYLDFLVLDAKGKPAAEASIHGVPGRPVVTVGADGRARIDQLWAQSMNFYATPVPNQYRTDPDFASLTKTLIPNGQFVTLKLRDGVKIKGVVVDQEGKPIKGVYVSSIGVDDQHRCDVRSSGDGSFEVLSTLNSSWRFKVQVSSPWNLPKMLSGGAFSPVVQTTDPRELLKLVVTVSR